MRDWAKHSHGSPLYAGFCDLIARDSELMRVISRIEHRPPPNVLFAGVQFMLARGADPELASYYASLVEAPLPPDEAGSAFRRFVLEHEEGLVEIGRTRYTQTNECRRCVALLPLTAMSRFERFHLIDVGTSAGLNLGLDKYHYLLGETPWGPEEALSLQCESRGVLPHLYPFEVMRRIGLDYRPVDVADPTERKWLEALIWPEHHERRERLNRALQLIEPLEIEMVPGDALVTLEEVLAGLPPGEPAVVMNSFTLIQFTLDERQRFENLVGRARAGRPIHRVSMETILKRDDWAKLRAGGEEGLMEMGQAHPHGEWIEIYARP